MNPSSYIRSIELSVVTALFVACGGQTDPNNALHQGAGGGISGASSSFAHGGSAASNAPTNAVGGDHSGGASSSVTTSFTVGGTNASLATSSSNGGSSSKAGATNAATGGSSPSVTQGGTITSASAGTNTRANTGGVSASGGSSSKTTNGAGAPSGGSHAGGPNSATSGSAGSGATAGNVNAGGTTASTTMTYLSLTEDLPGIWLIGWSGGNDHYSWVRFSAYDVSLGGQADILNVTGSGASWTSYVGCEGRGRWDLTARPSTISVRLPTSCQATGFTAVFGLMHTGSGSGMFSKTIADADVDVSGLDASGGNPIRAYKYPDAQCDAAMTSCQSPI